MKPQQIFMKRSLSIYAGMVRRASKSRAPFPLTLAELRTWLMGKFAGDYAGHSRCEYSGEMVIAENFSVDHRTPVSRGGTYGLENLAVCTEKHNLRKGNMNYQEYREFMLHLSHYPHEVQTAIWRKLEIGDVQRFSHFRRLNKSKKASAVSAIREV